MHLFVGLSEGWIWWEIFWDLDNCIFLLRIGERYLNNTFIAVTHALASRSGRLKRSAWPTSGSYSYDFANFVHHSHIFETMNWIKETLVHYRNSRLNCVFKIWKLSEWRVIWSISVTLIIVSEDVWVNSFIGNVWESKSDSCLVLSLQCTELYSVQYTCILIGVMK